MIRDLYEVREGEGTGRVEVGGVFAAYVGVEVYGGVMSVREESVIIRVGCGGCGVEIVGVGVVA